MPVTTITCPECATVLRPTKPLPETKTVKCPECGLSFAAGAGAKPAPAVKKASANPADRAAPAAKKPAPGKAAPPAKKPGPPKKAAAKKRDDDDEDGGGSYTVKHEPDAADEPEIDHVPDSSIKDLRGPAVEKVAPPSNYLLRHGIIGFFGWLLTLGLILLPVLFPLDAPPSDKARPAKKFAIARGGDGGGDTTKAPRALLGASPDGASSPTEPPPQPGGKAVKFEDDPRSSFRVADYDLMSLSNFVWYVFIFLVCVPCLLGMAYCAILIYGAVQVQNLESRKWGFASAIMCMLFWFVHGGTFVVAMVIAGFAFLALESVEILDADGIGFMGRASAVVMLILFITAPLVGIYTIVVLCRQDVIDGFEYVSEG